MASRDTTKSNKLRIAVRYLLERNQLHGGAQMRLAEHFGVSRQRVHQIVAEQRKAVADGTHTG